MEIDPRNVFHFTPPKKNFWNESSVDHKEIAYKIHVAHCPTCGEGFNVVFRSYYPTVCIHSCERCGKEVSYLGIPDSKEGC